MSRGREAALVAALAVVTTVVLTYPLAFQLGSGGRVDAEDGLFSIWSIAWVARTVVADPTDCERVRLERQIVKPGAFR